MPRRVFEGVRNRLAATGLAAGLLAAAGASASVEVHGSIGQSADIGPIEASLVPAPSLYELFGAVLNDDVSRLYPVEATVDVVDGRFVFEVSEPGVRWVRVRSAVAGERAFLLVGPETDTLLPSHDLKKIAFCTVSLKTPASAWIVRGSTLRDFGYARSWTAWPLIRRIEAGRPLRHEFRDDSYALSRSGSRRFERLTIGAPGYLPKVVECEAGADLAVELTRSTAPALNGVLRTNGVPEPGAILVGEDGWPVGATDEGGRFRAPAGIFHVLTAAGDLDAVEIVVGGAAELSAGAPPAVAVGARRGASSSGDMPRWSVVHWSSARMPLAFERGRLTGAPLTVKATRGAATTTVLAEGFAPLTIDWSALPAALSLEPLLRLEGTVADPTGAGVGGARLSIGAYGARPVAWSDGGGRFSLEVAEPPGRKQLVVRAAGYGEVRRDLSEVRGMGRQPIVLELTPHRTILGRLVAASGGGIRGTVGLAGPWGSEHFVGDAALWNVEDSILLQVVSTEEDGEFALHPTGSRDAWLVAAAPGHGTVRRKLPELGAGLPGEQHVGDVVLEPEIVLQGRVVDGDGAPVETATIVLGAGETFVHSFRRGPMRGPAGRLTTGPGGRFRIAGLAPGDQLSLRVSAPGFVRESIPLVRVNPSLGAEEVEVRLREALELSGRITDEVTGSAVEGVRVHFDQTVRGGFSMAETDETGEFLLSGFPVGTGVLSAVADGYEDLERPLSEPPSEPLELVLRPKPEIEVTGVVTREGAPVPGASVSIKTAVSLTDASGRFAVRSEQGQASLECHVPGSSQAIRRQIEVDANLGELMIDVTPVVLRGRVIEPDGLPLPAASVWAERDDGGWFDTRRTSTGPEGEFELLVEPGSYSVGARSENLDGPEVELEVAAGDAPYVELTGPGAGLLRVVVLGLTSAEAGEVFLMVETIRPSGGMSGRGMHAATGGTATEPVFEMPFRQPDGTTTVIASVESTGRARRAPLRMAPTGVTEVELSFADDTGVVEGTVTLDGWPLAGERVFVTAERRNLAWSVNTDHRGSFLIEGLRKGDEVAIVAVGQQRRVRVTETTSRVDFEAYNASVRGRLLDAETGLPAAGMRVSAVPAWSAAENEVARAVRRQATTRTAEDGTFVIDGLFAAPYRLEIRPAGRNLAAELVVGSSAVDLSGGDLEVTVAVPLTEER
ncbi:MAG: carboxypeptidase regulatory-like domain-containing protein [Acidobacteria bacterium]|nr:carboxypeptidase regulatory-like domain-containing protein [Acidobacteriota bacterium]